MSNTFSKAKRTVEGGFAIWLLNKSGQNTVKGEIVKAGATDYSFTVCGLDDLHPIGIVYTAGIADASGCWIVVAGIADILADRNGFARQDRLITSGADAGAAEASNLPTPAAHYQEIGHALETAAGGALGKAVIHFL